MPKWMLGILIVLAVHFSASYVDPLDEQARKTFSGGLKWIWPWAYGDHGFLGTLSSAASSFSLVGFFLAVMSAVLLLLGLLAILKWGVPFEWWQPCVTAGAVLQISLMILYFSPTKLIPIAIDLLLLYLATRYHGFKFNK